jgi:hypothetical protein
MKNIILIVLSVIFLSSCITLEDIQSKPQDWTIEPVLVLEWDGQTPANRWYSIIELGKVDTTVNGVPYIIREVYIQEGDSTKKVLMIEAELDETYKITKEMFK